MSFHVICSTADGNQTKKFSDWESAHQYANEWMDGFTHWNHRHFNSVESTEYVNLWKTRKGDVVKIQEVKSIDDSEKVWWDDEKAEYNTIDYAIQKQWQNRLQTLREKSVAEINFIDALDSVITRDEYRSLTDDQQRELIQAWLYPDNNEIDELIEEIPTDVHYEPNHPNLSENNEVQDLTSIEFFVANVKSYHASIFGVYCSNCFESESTLAVTTNNYTMFEFCKPCYDKLKRAMIARDAQERISA